MQLGISLMDADVLHEFDMIDTDESGTIRYTAKTYGTTNQP